MEEIFINIDSKYRDRIAYPKETKFRLNLEKTYKNIVSATINSLEINNSINYISTNKDNNYITLHLPNKLNDPDGTKIILYDGLLQLISSIKTLFNGIFAEIFNNNGGLQRLAYNGRPFAEKYFYIFYLNENTTITFDFNVENFNLPSTLIDKLVIVKGWHSIFGLVNQIKNYVRQKYNERKEYKMQNPNTTISNALDSGAFTMHGFYLRIFDRRFRSTQQLDCIRTDSIQSQTFNNTNLESNFDYLKTHIYKTYINDTTTFISASSSSGNSSTFGILDKLTSGIYVIPGDYAGANEFLKSNSKYHISNSSTNPRSTSTQIYNIINQVDLTALRVSFKNSFTAVLGNTPNYFYYYYVDPDYSGKASAWKRDESGVTINYVDKLLNIKRIFTKKNLNLVVI
jgi:hypothetical protein